MKKNYNKYNLVCEHKWFDIPGSNIVCYSWCIKCGILKYYNKIDPRYRNKKISSCEIYLNPHKAKFEYLFPELIKERRIQPPEKKNDEEKKLN